MAERKAAFRLVYRSYLRAGLIEPNPHRMRVTPYHLLPTTMIFVAKLDGTVISTMSLVCDGDLGLPMETTYGNLIQRRRERGVHIGEVTCLADRRRSFLRFLPHFCQLTRLVAHYARRLGIDQVLAVAHPRHARFYTRSMGFSMIGGLTTCPHVRNNPAVALCLDFAQVERERPMLYQTILGDPVPVDQLQPHPMPPEEIEYFEPLVDPCFRPSPAPPACAV